MVFLWDRSTGVCRLNYFNPSWMAINSARLGVNLLSKVRPSAKSRCSLLSLPTIRIPKWSCNSNSSIHIRFQILWGRLPSYHLGLLNAFRNGIMRYGSEYFPVLSDRARTCSGDRCVAMEYHFIYLKRHAPNITKETSPN